MTDPDKALSTPKDLANLHDGYFCEVCGKRISKEEFESFEGMCENCYTEYLQQIEDDEGYYPE